MKPMKPQVRKDGLVVKELPDEMLVYDLERHRGHCLNPTAALVWKRCDGQTSVKEIATLLQKELKTPPGKPGKPRKVDEKLVWLALDRLGKAHLLEERLSPPPEGARFARRELVRKLGLVGGLTVLLPLVTSIVAPTPAEAAATCVFDCSGQSDGTACPLPTCGSFCFGDSCM